MKDRRPRKLKKRLKKRFSVIQAMRMAQCAILTVTAAAQSASASAFGASRALVILQVAMDASEGIKNVLSTGPQNWREA